MTRGPAVRLAIGYAAVAATVPYLTLKIVWLCSGTVGMSDPGFFSDHPTYTVGNLLTVGMDAVAVLITLALTHRWGERVPAWLVLPPMWVASGFLVPIVIILPFAPIAFGDPAVDSGPLRSWVYLFVYSGFAVQGLLLTVAFVLYASSRWGQVLVGRNGDAAPGSTQAPQTLLTLVAASLATVVGTMHLAWALGAGVGLPDAVLSDSLVASRLTNGEYAAFAFAAAVGLLMLVYRSPRRFRLWVSLTLTWAGSGSMFAWALWQTATVAAIPDLGTPLLVVVTLAKMLAAVLVGVTAVLALRDRFISLPTTMRESY